MKRAFLSLVLLSLALAGCPAPDSSSSTGGTSDAGGSEATANGTATDETNGGATDETNGGATDETNGGATDETNGGDSSSQENASTTAGGDEAAKASDVALTSENTKIKFVCAHTDPEKPDPRTGWFEKLQGTAKVDGETLKSVNIDIETASLNTDIEKLTNHLKSADFFNVQEHPQAVFQSNKIEDAGDGKVNITGDLTLLETTKSITFPATVSTDGGLTLSAAFDIDRTEFGMNFGTENVEKKVAITVMIGK